MLSSRHNLFTVAAVSRCDNFENEMSGSTVFWPITKTKENEDKKKEDSSFLFVYNISSPKVKSKGDERAREEWRGWRTFVCVCECVCERGCARVCVYEEVCRVLEGEIEKERKDEFSIFVLIE